MALKKIQEVGQQLESESSHGFLTVLTCMLHKSVIICRQVNNNGNNVSQ